MEAQKPAPASIDVKTARLSIERKESQEDVLDQQAGGDGAAAEPEPIRTDCAYVFSEEADAHEEQPVEQEEQLVEQEAKPVKTEVISAVDWMARRRISEVNAYYMAMRALQGSLMYGKTPVAAVQGGFSGDPETYRILFIEHSLAFSTRKAERAWEEVIQASQKWLQKLGKRSAKNYRGVIQDAEKACKHKRGAKNTFIYGFLAEVIEGENEDVHVYALGLATYREPKPVLRGDEAKALSPEAFEKLFQERGGRLTIADIPKFIRVEAGSAARYSDLYFEDRNKEALEELEAAHESIDQSNGGKD